ncbi:hypothetical protein EVJ58_g10024 [Rhodofomes roseus]|uniref:POT family proton-dependent oligopeptide transporter n=1 Tax=Rhodofomes roseus TaxID=34475 RepID=A0A4Y9XRN4_9APHY|nr:hypothetical protein EVJ58_g10024 [Rhodofomes roseus]
MSSDFEVRWPNFQLSHRVSKLFRSFTGNGATVYSYYELRSFDEDSEVPTDEERVSLRRVADAVPWNAFLIAFVELGERFSYYGTTVVFTNFIQQPLPPGSRTGAGYADGQSGALGLGQRTSTAIGMLNTFWVYFMPLFGAYIADTRWGRFKTICVAVGIALVGHAILVVAALPGVIENTQLSLTYFIVALVIMGVGTGGFKSNISPLVAEQYQKTKLTVTTIASGERVIVDPAMTTARIYMYFYLFINIGALLGQIGMTYSEKAATMETYGVPNDIMSNLDPLSLIILIPLFDVIVYPLLRRHRVRLTPLRKITAGFFVASLGMGYTAFIQYRIYATNPCGRYAATCVDETGARVTSNMNVWVQAGSYILISISEVLASVTGLEYAYTKAPKGMRSLVMAVFMFMSAIASAVGEAFVALSADPLLVWNYMILKHAYGQAMSAPDKDSPPPHTHKPSPDDPPKDSEDDDVPGDKKMLDPDFLYGQTRRSIMTILASSALVVIIVTYLVQRPPTKLRRVVLSYMKNHPCQWVMHSRVGEGVLLRWAREDLIFDAGEEDTMVNGPVGPHFALGLDEGIPLKPSLRRPNVNNYGSA